jgi:anti-sigma factor RsiW
MKCNEPHKNLFSYAEQALGREERAEVERHLESCFSCREFLAYLSEFPGLIDKDIELISDNSFYNRVENRIKSRSAVRSLPIRRSILPDLVAASVLAVAVFAG